MVAGFDRYFQIAPCFRDEDPRADRLPGEFYQLDVEMSFVEQDDVFGAMEPVIRGVFDAFADGKSVTREFPRLPYREVMRAYGTDKPDLRNPIRMEAVTEHFAGSGFKVFASMIERDQTTEVWAIPAPGGGNRAFCDRMNNWAQGQGQPGLGYIFFREETGGEPAAGAPPAASEEVGPRIEGAGPLAKNIGPERTAAIRNQLNLDVGDAVFFVAGNPDDFTVFAGTARQKIGEDLGLVDEESFELAWIVDFPMFEWNEEEKKVDFSHNPFSMPQGGLEALESLDPLAIPAFQYDLVCNGYEIASGAIRNHKAEIMRKAFGIAGHSDELLMEKFGGMLRALEFGAPPHGGMAAGLDRIVMLLCGTKNLREITMFPMNQQAQDLLMGAPSEATPQQLRELSIRVVRQD
jgi:aspartyl-tRNA synthetase